jgi:hypothetical protein
MQNNQDVQVNQPQKGLQLDLANDLMKEDSITLLRNGTLTSFDGDFIHAITEQSNRLVCTLPYPIIGSIKMPDGKWALFLTDNISSEIGVFDENTFLYETKLNAEWLNFNKSNIISGRSKENADGSYSLYFADGRRNPDRIINLSSIGKATFDSIRLGKLISPPKLDIQQSTSGVLANGSYQAVLRYSMNEQGFGDYYALTLPQSIWSELDFTGALEVDIKALDSDFDFFELVIIQTRKNTTTAKYVGTYPRATSKIHVSNFEDPRYIKVDLEAITTVNQPWISSDQITGNNENLFRIGVETIPELNYQLQAFDIESEYVVHEFPENYHSYGDNVGHYRDEVYAYWIQWLHKTGVYSSAFTVAGRMAKPHELQIASTNDVYEGLVKKCDEETVPHFLVYNTAEPMIPVPSEETICEGREIGYGKMAYYESTDTYPANKFQFGEHAGTPIRFPKFPDEEKCPRYTVRDGKSYINMLGIRFKNIPHPKKDDGSIDTDWIGYRIIRANRAGNKSIISRVLLTNVRSYKDKIGNAEKEVFYSNYPINDLRADSFISETQTINKNNKEQNFNPLTTVHYDKFNAHSPHFNYSRYGLGEELKIESEEVADVTGHFREVHNHPKGKLLSLFSFWLAAILGAIEALLVTTGKSNFKSSSQIKITGVDAGNIREFETETRVQNVEDLIGLNPVQVIANAVRAGSGLSAINVVRQVLLGVAALGLKVITFTFWAIQYADQVLDVIHKFLGYTNYALQYNAHAFFNKQSTVEIGNKRRYISHYQYLQSGQANVNGKVYNNYRKNPSVYVELNQELGKFKNEDNSRQTITDLGIGNEIHKDVLTQGVAYYATNKRKVLNQYGRIESNINFILTHNNYFSVTPKEDETYSTPTIFGGDCFLVKDSIQTKHHFFTQDQTFPTLNKDGEEFNYLLYRNIGYPRFWANFFKYDFSELISKKVVNFTSFARTVTNRHNLDNKGKDKENKFRVDDAYFYTSSNAVLEYFVECDFNTYFREKSDNDTYHYSDKFSSIDEIFRSDRLVKDEQFKIDTSFSKQADQIYAQQQPVDYDPNVFSSKYKYSRNRIIYSLPSFQEYKYDNWQYFLSGNQYEFSKAEFGNLTSVHRVDGGRLLFLFDRSSPYITLGQNQLQLKDGTEIEIGSGGIFAQPPRELIYTEQHYGNSQSRYGSASTQFGTYYISERQGRFFKFSGNLDELTRNGIHSWSKNFFPIKLNQAFPDFKDSDNPVVGVGYLLSVDAEQDIIYISKKDYLPLNKDIVYDRQTNGFTLNGNPINSFDPQYFRDISFTLSFSPTLNSFVSFHDWNPDWVIPTEKNFITAKGNTLWKHNDDPVSNPCNYYGKQYSFEVEYIQNNKFQEETLSSIEWYLDCWKYAEDGINRTQLYNENFSHLIISNAEQISGLLPLIKESGNPFTDINYPKPTNLGFEILYSKVENKYRVDTFWDITKNRQSDMYLIQFQPDGYKRMVNPAAIDVGKSAFERKAFRSQWNRIHLIKDKPISKMILKLALSKSVKSHR